MAANQFESCIRECYTCAYACDTCASASLQEPDIKEMVECIRLDLDCADMCRLAAAVMGRGSEHAGRVCALCADICQACADECKKHPMDHCQQCASACKRCADACRAMSAQR